MARQLFYRLIFRQVEVGTGIENNTRLREILNTTAARLRDHQNYYWYQDFALDHVDLRLYPRIMTNANEIPQYMVLNLALHNKVKETSVYT